MAPTLHHPVLVQHLKPPSSLSQDPYETRNSRQFLVRNRTVEGVARDPQLLEARQVDVDQVEAATLRDVEITEVRGMYPVELEPVPARRADVQRQVGQLRRRLQQLVDEALVESLEEKVLLEDEDSQVREPAEHPQGLLRPVERHRETADRRCDRREEVEELDEEPLSVSLVVHQVVVVGRAPRNTVGIVRVGRAQRRLLPVHVGHPQLLARHGTQKRLQHLQPAVAVVGDVVRETQSPDRRSDVDQVPDKLLYVSAVGVVRARRIVRIRVGAGKRGQVDPAPQPERPHQHSPLAADLRCSAAVLQAEEGEDAHLAVDRYAGERKVGWFPTEHVLTLVQQQQEVLVRGGGARPVTVDVVVGARSKPRSRLYRLLLTFPDRFLIAKVVIVIVVTTDMTIVMTIVVVHFCFESADVIVDR